LPLSETFVLQSTTNIRQIQRQQLTTREAKPPPASSFDLESLEAFESELEQQAASLENNIDADEGDGLLQEGGSSLIERKRYEVTTKLSGKRIDAAIALLEPDLSRSVCGKLVTDGHVALVLRQKEESGKEEEETLQVINRKSFKVEAGQIIEVAITQEKNPSEIIPQNIPLNILFEDQHMIVINKAANMVVHPAAGNWDGTVVNALAYYFANESPFGAWEFQQRSGGDGTTVDGLDETTGEAISFRPGVVHRLDKGTTGILVVAKTNAALSALSQAFALRNVKKTYLAITVGNPGKRAVIDKPIERHPIKRQRMRVVPDHHKSSHGNTSRQRSVAFVDPLAPQRGRRALSMVDTIAFDGKLALAKVRIETGRTHQIRVHLQDRHTPIYGDEVYGLSDWNKRLASSHQIERPLLHAFRLEIDHPVTAERMVFKAPLAEDMYRIAKAIYPQGEKEVPEIFNLDIEFSTAERSL